MKNLKMFAIGLAAFAAMTMGVHAQMLGTTNCTESDNNGTVTNKCTLKQGDTFDTVKITEDMTIVTSDTNSLTIPSSVTVTVAEGKTLVIDGGNLKLNGTIRVLEGATLKVINGDKAAIEVAGSNTGKVVVSEKGNFEVSGNQNTSAVVVYGDLQITLKDGATLNVSNNKGNGINGVGSNGYIKATDSHIIVKDNGQSGISGRIILANSDLTATGNGLSGVVFAGATGKASSIDANSTVVATGNLTDTTYEKLADKADILVNGYVNVAGKITAGSMTPLKVTWSTTQNPNDVKDTYVKLTDEKAIIDVEEFKVVCDGTTIGGSCLDTAKNTISFVAGSKGLVVEGDKATVYGDVKEVTIPTDVKEVVIDENAGADMTVIAAPGVKISNASTHKVIVKSTTGDVYTVDAAVEGKASEYTVPGQVATEPGQTEPTVPSDEEQNNNPVVGDDANSQQPVDNVQPAKTGDNIVTFMGLGLASLAVVAYGAKNLKKQFN